jgi:hypothetical protein
MSLKTSLQQAPRVLKGFNRFGLSESNYPQSSWYGSGFHDVALWAEQMYMQSQKSIRPSYPLIAQPPIPNPNHVESFGQAPFSNSSTSASQS